MGSNIDFNRPLHVRVSFVSLAPIYFISQNALMLLLLLSKSNPLALGFDLGGGFAADLEKLQSTPRLRQSRSWNRTSTGKTRAGTDTLILKNQTFSGSG